MGNVDMAVEFLMNGIPDVNPMTEDPAAAGAAAAAADSGPLAQLRAHPQFDDLRRTIQANPGSLQQVLQQPRAASRAPGARRRAPAGSAARTPSCCSSSTPTRPTSSP